MTSALLIIFIVVLYSLQTLFCTLYNKSYPGKAENASPVFCILESVAIAVFTWAWIGFKFEISPMTLLFGVLNAVALFGYNTSLIKASTKGSYAFMNVAMLFGGILVPLLYTTVFLGDTLSWYQYLAIGLMLVSFVLMNYKEIKLKDTPWTYYIFCALLFICNGMYGTFLKMQSDYDVSQKNEMIILTYGIMGVIAFIQLALKEKKDIFKAFRMSKKAVLPLVLCLASAALAINILVMVIPMVNTAVLYTVENGGVLILSAVYSFIFFKEKPQVMTILGILLATASITVLSI
jgi:drug/metabolite transporter (DMT)-like permease